MRSSPRSAQRAVRRKRVPGAAAPKESGWKSFPASSRLAHRLRSALRPRRLLQPGCRGQPKRAWLPHARRPSVGPPERRPVRERLGGWRMSPLLQQPLARLRQACRSPTGAVLVRSERFARLPLPRLPVRSSRGLRSGALRPARWRRRPWQEAHWRRLGRLSLAARRSSLAVVRLYQGGLGAFPVRPGLLTHRRWLLRARAEVAPGLQAERARRPSPSG